jgi:hypothetical protein
MSASSPEEEPCTRSSGSPADLRAPRRGPRPLHGPTAARAGGDVQRAPRDRLQPSLRFTDRVRLRRSVGTVRRHLTVVRAGGVGSLRTRSRRAPRLRRRASTRRTPPRGPFLHSSRIPGSERALAGSRGARRHGGAPRSAKTRSTCDSHHSSRELAPTQRVERNRSSTRQRAIGPQLTRDEPSRSPERALYNGPRQRNLLSQYA